MREVELKSVVPDLDAARRRMEQSGATLTRAGRMEDRRYDTPERTLAARDHVLRLRVYRESGRTSASLDWKGSTRIDAGYKVREELNTMIGDPDALGRILEQLAYVVTMEIDREIWQYDASGTIVRFERYPRMDDLVEVEGEPAGIEAAIGVLALPRDGFSPERLPAFARRYETRTGQHAALSDAALDGRRIYHVDDA
ncbi:MAG TPA: class IV adenylate cyclase [Gemmatimonadaceae bacterium]|nr:class IV adenylate cyclase [Gemmatimonadaceae bacterium]